MRASQAAGRRIFTVAKPPPGTVRTLLREGSPVTMNALLPGAIAGTVSIRVFPVHASHGGAAVSAAPSLVEILRSWAPTGYFAGSNALPGLPQ